MMRQVFQCLRNTVRAEIGRRSTRHPTKPAEWAHNTYLVIELPSQNDAIDALLNQINLPIVDAYHQVELVQS